MVFLLGLQDSSSSESLDGRSLDSAKSFDAVVFDMLKVTPEEFAVSLYNKCSSPYLSTSKYIHILVTMHFIVI